MNKQRLHFALVALLAATLSGCFNLRPQSATSVRLDTILTPVKDSLLVTDKKPLVFPTTVAVLMVPSRNTTLIPATTLRRAAEDLKKELLKNEAYVNGVAIISPDDIREKVTLQTIHDLYGADILIVLTHQQDNRHVQGSFAQLANLAIAPAFMIPSVKVTTTTAVDGKIIHIPSNAIIFRSNGFDERHRWLTPVSADGNVADEEAIRGFSSAVLDFGRNVSRKLGQLQDFDMSKAVPLASVLEETAVAAGGTVGANGAGATGARTPSRQVAANGDDWGRVDSYKRSGGGALDAWPLLVLALTGLLRATRRRA